MALSPIKRIGFVALGAVLFCAGLWLSWSAFKPASRAPLEIAGIYLPEPKPITSFNLLDASGQAFTQEQLKNHWTFIYFGYTYCPDACPLTLSQLNQVDKQLSEQNTANDTAYLLVSVDPRRDTPERLAEYTQFFNPKFQGVSGQVEELNKLTESLGIYYSVPEQPEDPANYLVDHSSVLVLVNPAGELQALFSAPHDPARIVEDFLTIRQRWSA